MNKVWLIMAIVCVWSIRTALLWAGEGNAQPGGTGKPPAASPPASPSDSGQATASSTTANTDQTTPPADNMPPLSGAEVLTPGFGGVVYSYFLPAFQWTGYGDTNPSGFGSHGGLDTQSTYTGSLTLQRIQKHSQLNLGGIAGAFFYSQPFSGVIQPDEKPFGMFEELSVTEQVSTRRWKWMLGDQGMYLPETPIGFFGFGGLTSFGGGLGGEALANAPALGSSFNPSQSILTGNARRLSDSAFTQLEYDASGRSSLTATASFGTLQFLEPGFIDSRYWTIMAGYNHRLGMHDEVAVTYDDYYYRFNQPNQVLLNRGLSILYGHQIAGRLSLQVSVSPTVMQIAQPLGGVSTKSFFGTYDSLQYRASRWGTKLSFDRMTQGGSGVLPGAETDLTQGSFDTQLSRKIHASFQVSHAYNESLAQESALALRSKFESWEAGFSISRELGHHISAYVNYHFQRQISNAPLCVGTNCTTSFLRQVGGVGISWHTRPIKID